MVNARIFLVCFWVLAADLHDWGGGAGGPCSLCNSSVWCLNGQANPCPPNSNASIGSSQLSQCLCKPGYYGDTSMTGIGYPTLCQVRGLSRARERTFWSFSCVHSKQAIIVGGVGAWLGTPISNHVECKRSGHFLACLRPKTPLAYHSIISTMHAVRRAV